MLKKIIVVISPEVIYEAKRVIKNKFSLLEIPFLDFLTNQPYCFSMDNGAATTTLGACLPGRNLVEGGR